MQKYEPSKEGEIRCSKNKYLLLACHTHHTLHGVMGQSKTNRLGDKNVSYHRCCRWLLVIHDHKIILCWIVFNIFVSYKYVLMWLLFQWSWCIDRINIMTTKYTWWKLKLLLIKKLLPLHGYQIITCFAQ